jgi:hypothetical protein
MSLNDLEASIIADLESVGDVSPATRQMVGDYCLHAREVERLDATLARLTPGAADYKRVSTAKAREARARDTAARHAGLTAGLAAAREKKPNSGGLALHEMFGETRAEREASEAAWLALSDEEREAVIEAEEREQAEVLRRLRAKMALDSARSVAEASVGGRFEDQNAELLRQAEAEHGWIEGAS